MGDTTAILKDLEDLLHSAGGFEEAFIEVRDNGAETIVGGNQPGLIWLAAQLLALSRKSARGSHVHIDAASGADISERPLVLRLSAGPEV